MNNGVGIAKKLPLYVRERVIMSCAKIFGITFSGVDGSGKSTQIDMLCERLKKEGIRCKRLWVRGGYTPGFLVIKAVLRRLAFGVVEGPGKSGQREKFFCSGIWRKLWLCFAVVDLCVYTAVWARVLTIMGKAVLFDRYWDDTAIDFEINLGGETRDIGLLWRCCRSLALRPKVSFIFLIPVAETMRRSRLKGEPFPDSEGVLKVRFARYQKLAAMGQGRLMDGLRPPEDLHSEICTICGIG